MMKITMPKVVPEIYDGDRIVWECHAINGDKVICNSAEDALDLCHEELDRYIDACKRINRQGG